MLTAAQIYIMSLDNQNIHGADEMVRRLSEAKLYLADDVKTVVGVEAVNHFKGSFQNEGFTDSNLQKWASRKSKRAGGTNSQKILTKSGELGDSIDYRVEGDTVIIYTDKVYAQIHNEGGEITVTPQMKKMFWAKMFEAKNAGDTGTAEQYKFMALAKTIKIPKREFMGDSKQLVDNITSKIVRDLNNILNS